MFVIYLYAFVISLIPTVLFCEQRLKQNNRLRYGATGDAPDDTRDGDDDESDD